MVIGKRWLQIGGKRRRLDDPEDIVRLEIEAALTNEIPIVPVLVGGAKFPSADKLPASMKGLARSRGYEIPDGMWKANIGQVLAAISDALQSKTHLHILKRGAEKWNDWRQHNPDVAPKLRVANLVKATLSGANLTGVDLSGATLEGANLAAADLLSARLAGADLTYANLRAARLDQANLSDANLRVITHA